MKAKCISTHHSYGLIPLDVHPCAHSASEGIPVGDFDPQHVPRLWKGWKGHLDRTNTWRTEACWSLGFFTFQEIMKQWWYWHSCLSRGQEPPLQIVSPPDEGKGRTALDIISFAVENKSIEKASFQSSNTITGSITLILVWGGMVSATRYLWAFLCLIYFFPVQKVTTLNGLRLFTKHFLHTCSRFTYKNLELDLTIKVPDIVALGSQRNIMRIPYSSQGMKSLSAAIQSHLTIIPAGRQQAPAKTHHHPFKNLRQECSANSINLVNLIFFFPSISQKGARFSLFDQTEHQLWTPEELNSGAMLGSDSIHASWASSEWGSYLNSAWRNIQHLLFWKFLSPYSDTHRLPNDFTTPLAFCLSRCSSTFFIPWQGQAHSPPSDTSFLL